MMISWLQFLNFVVDYSIIGTSVLKTTLEQFGVMSRYHDIIIYYNQQRTLTPPDTWSCPTLGLASVLMLRPISLELVLFLDF